MENNRWELPYYYDNKIWKGVAGGQLDAYLIGLEAWKRGLTVNWYDFPTADFTNLIIKHKNYAGRLISISSEEKTHCFFGSRGDQNTFEAYQNTQNKVIAKEQLKKAGIPVPEGGAFAENAPDHAIIEYGESIGFPLVLKPTNQGMGRGVFTNISDRNSLEKILAHVREKLRYRAVIVEKFYEGNDYRLYVVNDQVVGAINRIPANVTGDGSNTIEYLIDQKNQMRKENPFLSPKPIVIDEELMRFIERAGYKLQSVLPEGEFIYLRGKSNASAGGDSIDATDTLPREVKQLAVEAIKASGLAHGGVDFIIEEDNDEIKNMVILELGSAAELGLHVFPLLGKARDIPAAVLDLYFPETKGHKTADAGLYFDLYDIIAPLKKRIATEVRLKSPPLSQIYKRKFIVTGHVQGVGYLNWIRKKALEFDLNGYAKNLIDGSVEIIAGGESEEQLNHFREACKTGPEGASVAEVRENEWDGLVCYGFEQIYNKERKLKVALKKKEKELTKKERRIAALKSTIAGQRKEIKRIKRKFNNIKQSRIWRYTQPLRKLLKALKKISP